MFENGLHPKSLLIIAGSFWKKTAEASLFEEALTKAYLRARSSSEASQSFLLHHDRGLAPMSVGTRLDSVWLGTESRRKTNLSFSDRMISIATQ